MSRRSKLGFIALHLAVFVGYLPWLCGQVLHKTEGMGSDFTVFYSGWTLVLRGRARDLYDVVAQRSVQRELMNGLEFPGGLVPFLHPPHAALVMSPLALLPRTPATWLWTLIQLALLAWLLRGVLRVVGARTAIDRWVVLAAVLAFPPLFASLHLGQVSPVLAVALLGLVLAVEEGRDGVAAVCLVILSIKPHLVLVPLAVLVAARRWGLLARAALLAAAAAVVTMTALGWRIFAEYLVAVPRLEPLWGKFGPLYMVNLRGALMRIPGATEPLVNLVALAGLAAATIAVCLLVRRRLARGVPLADCWPFALALGLLFNPHLFLHDALLWVVPLALHYRQARLRGTDVTPFVVFVLAWPLVDLLNEVVELSERVLPIHLLVLEGVVAAVWMFSPPAAPETA